MAYEENIAKYASEMEGVCRKNDSIPDELFSKYDVNRGLRDKNGKGVLTGLTGISKIKAFNEAGGIKTPCDGELWYRGRTIESLVGNVEEGGFGFERVAYLLLFGEWPDEEKIRAFKEILAEGEHLPTNFTRDVIMKAPSADIMNSMTRSILTLASYDNKALDTSVGNVIRQCIQLIACFPMLAVYGYNAYLHYEKNGSMYIHRPEHGLSIAENVLRMLRPDMSYTPGEAKALDIALMLHAEHGGGNNSTFTTRVVTSSGADTYSAFAAAMSSLKGPKHGGANIKVVEMMDDIAAHVADTSDIEEVESYVGKILHKEAFDRTGLVYGMGHAVYSISDPRERILRSTAESLAKEKGLEGTLGLYENVEEAATKLIAKERKIYKGVSANVDFYSGFVYRMLGIPKELFTPIFAIARIAGWSAHRVEELVGNGRIIRPAYMSVMPES